MTDDPPTPRSETFQIQVRGIHKTFGEHHVLRGIDLDVERGRINVVIGGSGAGKSVIMKHLIGLLKPDRGSILVDGEDIVPMNDFQLNRHFRHEMLWPGRPCVFLDGSFFFYHIRIILPWLGKKAR